MNDVDTGLGKWEGRVQYTINRQNVFGELMHLADYPHSVQGTRTQRIPIILTGNDFTKLYEPLTRAGRMTSFEWKPTLGEKARIIAPFFPNLQATECRGLVEHFAAEPLAFFAALLSAFTNDQLYEAVQQVGVRQTMSQIRKGREPALSVKISYDELVYAGEELMVSGQFVDHLRAM